MEYLDYYDEKQNYLGRETRKVVHENALWHKTVHCWLYDNDGNIYFQIRKDEGKFYTTASGHVVAGEDVKEAFGREIKEEIGIDLNYNNASLVDVVKFKMDKVKSDGSIFKDRAFANVFAYEFDNDISNLDFDESEVAGLVKVNAKSALRLMENAEGSIEAEIIKKENGNIVTEARKINFDEFLVNKGETGIGKYGQVLNKVIELTNPEKI